MGKTRIDAKELQNVLSATDELKFILFSSLDKLCHTCNSKSECSCFYDEGKDLSPWKIVCHIGKKNVDVINLEKVLDKESKDINRICESYADSKPELYRTDKKKDSNEEQKELTEGEVMDVVAKSLQDKTKTKTKTQSTKNNGQKKSSGPPAKKRKTK